MISLEERTYLNRGDAVNDLSSAALVWAAKQEDPFWNLMPPRSK